jgi:hypothetical protein
VAFEEAVNDYLETCIKVGKKIQEPYSGKLILRIRPEIHAAVATAAELSGQTIDMTDNRTGGSATGFQHLKLHALYKKSHWLEGGR